MERRHFLKTAVLGAVAGTVGLKGMKLFASEKTAPGTIPGKDNIPDLVAIMGENPNNFMPGPFRKWVACPGISNPE